MVSAADTAKRTLVKLIRFLAGVYSVTVDVTRDSREEVVRTAYRALSRKVHPDKGGSQDDQKKLNESYQSWCDAARS